MIEGVWQKLASERRATVSAAIQHCEAEVNPVRLKGARHKAAER